MAKTKKMTRADKIEKNLTALNEVRSEIKDYSEVEAELKSEGSKVKARRILTRLKTDEAYLVESTCRQGFMMIVEAQKVESFINALPAILKA